jgi:hypothetical protein
MAKIFSRVWGWGPSRLILKEWAISFDPTRDVLAPTKVWAILPKLPIFFGEEAIMEYIGNKIGKFVSCEPDWKDKNDRR